MKKEKIKMIFDVLTEHGWDTKKGYKNIFTKTGNLKNIRWDEKICIAEKYISTNEYDLWNENSIFDLDEDDEEDNYVAKISLTPNFLILPVVTGFILKEICCAVGNNIQIGLNDDIQTKEDFEFLLNQCEEKIRGLKKKIKEFKNKRKLREMEEDFKNVEENR